MTTLSKIIVATITKLIVATVFSLLLYSCNFDINLNPGIRGNGDVTQEDRMINESFKAITAGEGLDVYITQGDTENITVEADENLQEFILTEIVDGVLKIHTKKNIGWASSKKVMVTYEDVTNIKSSSGSNIYSTNTISTKNLNLDSSSGSNMKLDINTSSLNCESSSGSNMILSVNTSDLKCLSTSGSNINLSGKTVKLTAKANSGSGIKASGLMAESSQVNANSGANITVNTSKELVANANSGGGIQYYGNPEKVEKNADPSGGISKR